MTYDDVWSFNLRTFVDEGEDEDPSHPLVAPGSCDLARSEDQWLKDLDITSREETVNYKPNPFSIAKINAISRASKDSTISAPTTYMSNSITPAQPKKLTTGNRQATIIDGFRKQAQLPRTTCSTILKTDSVFTLETQKCVPRDSNDQTTARSTTVGLDLPAEILHSPVDTDTIKFTYLQDNSKLVADLKEKQIKEASPRIYAPSTEEFQDTNQTEFVKVTHATKFTLPVVSSSGTTTRPRIQTARPSFRKRGIYLCFSHAAPPFVTNSIFLPIARSKMRACKTSKIYNASLPQDINLSYLHLTPMKENAGNGHRLYDTDLSSDDTLVASPTLPHLDQPKVVSPPLGKRKPPAYQSVDSDQDWSTFPRKKVKARPRGVAKITRPFRLPGISMPGEKTGMSATSERRVITFLPPPLQLDQVSNLSKDHTPSQVSKAVGGNFIPARPPSFIPVNDDIQALVDTTAIANRYPQAHQVKRQRFGNYFNHRVAE
ncbi:hypothetical protein AMATHDRAFT_4954 [Amanita thiersii Skay4041]|uniref:Uncharacterized protein n=1 Tax=Amanita thiersii Skay4041 TaxID=703135 RepID=A0A2A9NED6_9AGAR|nr:hypothetical protein AMATHDRAFT_4954 [Amanita thiersii Skay4041]